MSLSIGPSLGTYSGAGAPRQADSTNGAATSGQSGGAQGGRSQITDQINITSITININQATTSPNSNDLTSAVGPAITPLADGGSPVQPLGRGGSSSTASEASITLQILSEAANTSDQAQDRPSRSGDLPARAQGGQSGNAAYVSVNISI
jgi:hypothetical protein